MDKFIVRLPDGLRDQIKLAADASGRSMNAEVVFRLETYDRLRGAQMASGRALAMRGAQVKELEAQLLLTTNEDEQFQQIGPVARYLAQIDHKLERLFELIEGQQSETESLFSSAGSKLGRTDRPPKSLEKSRKGSSLITPPRKRNQEE